MELTVTNGRVTLSCARGRHAGGHSTEIISSPECTRDTVMPFGRYEHNNAPQAVSNFRCRIVGPSDEHRMANSGAGRVTVRKLAGGAWYEWMHF